MRRLVATLFVLAATSAFAHEGIHEQIAEISRRIAREPNQARLYMRRGELHRIHGDHGLALRDYARAARIDPNLATVDLARGRLYLAAGQYLEAKRALDRVDGRNVEGAVLRARTLSALGFTSQAVAEWDKAGRLNQNPTPEFFLEWAKAVPDAKRAVAILDEGITRLGPLVNLELAAVDLELRHQNHDAALARIEVLAAQSPRKESWLTRRGEILLLANRLSAACEAFEEARHNLEILPEPRRRTRAMVELERRIAVSRCLCPFP